MRGSHRVGDQVETWTRTPDKQGIRWICRRPGGDSVELLHDGRRLIALHDGWAVRAGVVGGHVEWTRAPEAEVGELRRTEAVGFTGTSPAYDVALATVLGLAVGESRTVRLLEVTEPVGATRTVQHGWARTMDPEPDVQRYEVADLQTAERWVLHLSDGVLLSREGARSAVLLELVL